MRDISFGDHDKRLAVPVQLKVPQRLTKEEETAVLKMLDKCRHNRFEIQSNGVIEPYSNVDLLKLENRSSLTNDCLKVIEKRWTIEDIDSISVGRRENTDLFIVDNGNLQKGFICCLFFEDMKKFSNNMTEVSNFGVIVANDQPYRPDKFELCIALHSDDDGTKVWYRAQYQQELANGRAQIGLIDFETTVVVDIQNIRKFPDHLTFNRITFICKIRCINNSLDLLNRNLFENFNVVTPKLLEPIGRSFELHFDQSYFFEDENFEEEMLMLED